MSLKDSENSPLLPPPTSPETALENGENAENREFDDEENEEDVENSRRGNKCNPFLIIVISLLIILLVMMGIVIVLQFFGKTHMEKMDEKIKTIDANLVSKKAGRGICETNECATLSAQLMNWRNQKIDPCQDFYEAACGRYLEHTSTQGTRVLEKETIVRGLVKEHLLKNISTTSKSENALKLLYAKCEEMRSPLKGKALESEMYRQVLADIEKIGSWPILETNWKPKTDVNSMILKMAEFGVRNYGFFEVFALEYPYKNAKKQLFIRPEIAKIGAKAVLPEELKMTIERILMKNNISYSKIQFEKDYEDYCNLSAEIRTLHTANHKNYEFEDLISEIPKIQFEKIIKNLINPGSGTWEKIRPVISTAGFDLFFGEEQSLKTILDSTDARILTNMLIYKFIEKTFHPMVFRKAVEQSKKDVTCVDTIINALPRAALRVYVRNYLNKDNLKLAGEMIENIKLSYYEIIQESTWLDEETKKNATQKVKKMKTMIGYPEEYEQAGALDRMFETLNYTQSDSFYKFMTKIERFKTEQVMDFVVSDSILNPSEPLVVANAYYFPLRNFMNILVPFLVDPIFDSNFPKYATMSGIGRVLAHEIGHAFDYSGRFTDETGNVQKWFTGPLEKEYFQRANCLVQQYKRIVEPDEMEEVENTHVVSEMIADALGTQAQWRTYKKMNMTGELRLHGFETETFDKLFFYVGALDFCSPKIIKDAAIPSVPVTHPPNKFRVNGVFSNMPGFAEAFKCPKGTPMNPSDRCQFF